MGELIANMYSHGGPQKKFFASGWNVFDTIIVMVGVLTMADVLKPPLNKLKLMRAFRVFRLFKRVESLNKIIVALLRSVPGFVNAFFVMVVFFCIYAILAVELFRDFGEGGTYTTYDETTGIEAAVNSTSSRGYLLGIEYYGSFMRALYTLFQVMTGESWSEAVARPLLFGWDRDHAIVVSVFFVSFIILTQLVLINVVVAVLLENFVAEEPEEDVDGEVDKWLSDLDAKEAAAASNDIHNKLDKLLSTNDKVSNEVAVLRTSVASLRAELNAIREERTDSYIDTSDGKARFNL